MTANNKTNTDDIIQAFVMPSVHTFECNTEN